MPLLGGGLALALLGLGVLLAQTVRLLPPGLVVSLLAFGVAFVGIVLGVAGMVRCFHTRR